jgi:protocatechuate 3,4-dioxygenase beta subunit
LFWLRRRHLLAGALTIVALSSVSCLLYAQQIVGTAYIGDRLAPSAATSILLIDSAGRVVTGTITDSSGRYAEKAQRSGWFRIRARRIGFSPDSSNFVRIENGQTITFDPKMNRVTANLAVVSVKGAQRCVIRPAEGEIAFRLWEAAQNVLSATVVSSLDNQTGFVLERFQRQLDPATKRILGQRVWETRTFSSEPYLSLPAESLATYGFVRSGSDSSTYFAPDARTLTSDVFAQAHCFRPVTDSKHDDRIGLAFEPISRTKNIDVAGTLWLDRATAELRSLEYHYDFGRDDDAAVAGGYVDYARLKNGLSIVTDWAIRAPVRKQEMQATPSSSGDISSRSLLRRSHTAHTIAVWEFGGKVKAVLDSAQLTSGRSSLSVVRGTVLRQEGQNGLSGVRVELTTAHEQGKILRVVTDNDGSFKFDAIEEGDYLLIVPEPRLDTLNTPVVPLAVHVNPATEETVTITVPEPNAGRDALCPSGLSSKSIVLHGVVRDSASGQPIPHARVSASWLSDVQVTGRGIRISAVPHVVSTLTDSLGRYALCQVEPTNHLLLRAERGAVRSPRYPSLTVRSGETLLYDLRIGQYRADPP